MAVVAHVIYERSLGSFVLLETFVLTSSAGCSLDIQRDRIELNSERYKPIQNTLCCFFLHLLTLDDNERTSFFTHDR